MGLGYGEQDDVEHSKSMENFGNFSRKASITYSLPQVYFVRGEYNRFTPTVEEIAFSDASCGYGQQEDGECSKAKKAHEGVSRTFTTCSLPQVCEVCVHEE